MFDIVYELRQRQHEFSPVEARIASTILADVDAAAQYGVTELADRAGVSAAAISRFAKALGCEHVRELRARLASASAVGKRFLEQQNAPPVSALCWLLLPTCALRCLARNSQPPTGGSIFRPNTVSHGSCRALSA